MEKTDKSPSLTACRHLGLAENPFQHNETPTEEHRCYLWMQRDCIDMDHQKGYCLSGRYRDCPWLHISLPCEPKLKTFWRERVVCTISETGQRAGPHFASASKAAERAAAHGARSMGLWILHNLPVAIGWLKREIPVLAGAVGRLLARTIIRKDQKSERKEALPVPVETEDLNMLMRLGKEANKAGNREQARLCFTQATALDPSSEEAWLWMAATAGDPAEAQRCLEKALTINPASGRARAQLADVDKPAPGTRASTRASRGTVRTKAAAPALVKKGIAALDAGNEDEAYQLFTTATQTDKTNEAAWFWRAKTATDLNEVIMSLQQVLELNPDNEKARASLGWAMDRQRTNTNRTRAIQSSQPGPIVPALYSPKVPARQSSLLQIASSLYMAVGVLWIAPLVLPSLDGFIASLYRAIGLLPTLQLPNLSSSAVFNDSSIPEFNLLYAIPLLVAVLSFVAMETVWNDRGTASMYLAMVSLVSIFAIGMFGVGFVSSVFLMAISGLAGVLAMGGRITYRKRSRSRPAVTGLTPTTGLTRIAGA